MAFQAAVAVEPLTSHTYAANLADEYCIGTVPNGGYVLAVIHSAISAHFNTTLQHLNQPDTMTSQVQFVRRTGSGPGIVTIKHVKLGRGVSVIYAVLSQHNEEEVIGLFTRTNFETQAGISLKTSFDTLGLEPAPLPVDFRKLEQHGEDANWTHLKVVPHIKFRRALYNIEFYHPRHGPIGPHKAQPRPTDPSTTDQWVQFRPGGLGKDLAPFKDDSLAFVADMFPLIVDQYPVKREARWYPTVSLNLDVKRRLPPGGTDWLFVRARSLMIKDGRFDIQLTVLDKDMNLVVTSSHVALILSTDRNTAERVRGKVDDDDDDTKRGNKL